MDPEDNGQDQSQGETPAEGEGATDSAGEEAPAEEGGGEGVPAAA